MSDIHIEDFYKDVAKILAQLYGCFPRKSILYVEDIAGPDAPDEFGLHSERHQACFGTMVWLAESGYLQYGETIRQEALDQACLTHKGFTLLSTRATFVADGSIDQSAGEHAGETRAALAAEPGRGITYNINQLRQALKSRSSSLIRQTVHQLLLESRHHR
ncbi:hypothetical protein FKG94_25060 [Exilibacterium tricleocarpae]|uniref:Uncharacterized protein n=1 Tax=Exilibacterium tricleocarpae TaxID=2591008 RepID=A0A545SS59_9GAMM|nr:hypothetical protein [Exilibacterium tricleocarpae]TQV67801.1 hypothetical protein FKG94_25060 [Exilibacterium tricleocarpae]